MWLLKHALYDVYYIKYAHCFVVLCFVFHYSISSKGLMGFIFPRSFIGAGSSVGLPQMPSKSPIIWWSITHWGQVMHICVSKLTIIGSDNGLSPGRRQAIIWANAGILLIRTWGTNFSEILSEIRAFSFKKMHLKMSSAKWRPFCLCFNVLI